MNEPARERWSLAAEIRRVLGRVAAHLARQRQRGRAASADLLAGFAIEEGEAEGLIADLDRELGDEPARPAGVSIGLHETERAPERPLARAALAFELTEAELDMLVLALAVEHHGRFARLVGFLNDHVGRTRPTIGLALSIADAPPSAVDLLERPILRDGLLELEGEGPLSGLSLRVPREMLVRLSATVIDDVAPVPGVQLHAQDEQRLADLVLAGEVRARLTSWVDAARGGRAVGPLLIAGAGGQGRATVARAALSAVGVPAVEIVVASAERLRAARREARWHAAGIVARLAEGPTDVDAAVLWGELQSCPCPVAVIAPTAALDALTGGTRTEPHVLTLSNPDLHERAALWRALCAGEALTPRDIDELAARFEFNPRAIARAVRRARAERDLSGAGPLVAADLFRACREVGSAAIGPTAQRLPLPYTRDDLVVPAPLRAELELAIAWVRHKRLVFDSWGFGRRVVMGRGLTALFAGPPGTGKTMAAQVLARELGLDLYRVDLSRVMSKYIGETEKNLSRLFDEAQASGAVLFFDEADALFGKRSEVRDAHDRYANVEIGYLLQRMEEHEGAAVLATNRMGDLDDAFRRRLHFILEFPLPSPDDRLRIWQGMIPREVEREPDLDLEVLAQSYELTGGEIRNCVLAAAYMAAADGARVGTSHLRRGIRRELQKSGRVIIEPLGLA